MLANHNACGTRNTVSAKMERATAEMVGKQLMDIRSDKNKLFTYKVFYIFNNSTMSILKRELGAFVAEIESLVSVLNIITFGDTVSSVIMVAIIIV